LQLELIKFLFMKKKLLSVKRLSLMALTFVLSGSVFSQSQTFNFTGAVQTFTVPCGVNSVFIQTWGAQGGSGATGGGAVAGGSGGLGGYSEGFLLVNPGDVLNVFVGEQGATPTGGYNGGANGGTQNAGGGGGATDVRVGGITEANRIITAGGGGGGGRGGCDEGSATTAGIGGNGGVGGGGVGTNGNDSPTSGGAAGGGGGGNFGATQGAPGPAGIGCGGFLGTPGSTAVTGTGATGGGGQSCCCSSGPSIPGGGGGGGGQIGGGGGGGGSAGTTGCSGNSKGAGGGGGGGSSYVGGVTSGASVNGIWLGNGMCTISWTSPTPPSHVISGPAAICEGTTTNLSIPADIYSTFYIWDVPSGLTFVSGQNTTDIAIVGATPGTYTVTVTGVNGTCSLTGPTDSFIITVNANAVVNADATSTSLCDGESVTLTSTGDADSYSWDNSVVEGVAFTPAVGSVTYTVTGSALNGCSSSASVTVDVNALPTVDLTASMSGTVCGGQDIALTGSPAGGTYSVIAGASSALVGSTFNALTAGTYNVQYDYTDGNGCSNNDTLIFIVNCFLGLEILGENGSLNVYPNPAQGSFSINSLSPINGSVELYDEMGKLVFSQKVTQMKNKQFDIKTLETGIYNIQIINDNEIFNGKLSVIK
jgi:hypothetical protein